MSPEHYHAVAFYCVTIFLFLLISAFFSAAETSMTAVSRARIYQLVMEGSKAASIVSRLRRNKESMIGTVLLGNNVVNIGASTLATGLSIMLFGTDGEDGDGLALIIATVVMTLLVVIFCEVLPKTYAIQQSEYVALRLAGMLSVCVWLFWPLTRALQMVVGTLMRLMRLNDAGGNIVSATDVIRGTIELHHREGAMIKQDRDMLGSILDLNDIPVSDIMTHRGGVEALDADQPVDALIHQAVSTMHSRIPLYREEPDNIIGLLHMKSLIKLLNELRLAGTKVTTAQVLGICQKPWFIPESTTLRAQLLAFRSKRQHFAFVVDEYGAWQGIVTLEDIMEEIVGNIEDEHDERDNAIQKVSEGVYAVQGNVPIRDVNRQLDWNLPDEHASTIAGLLIHTVQNIPPVGAQFELFGCRFSVLAKEATRITRLRIEKLATPPEGAQ